ncbi:MAG TPA: hypothetical protein VFV37_07360, partial [Luteibaculaceae bacterium]|nr:hypothetical protein [Luteibaculaceae bacterium]
VTDAVTIDFRTKPNPNAGLDDSTCSTSYALAANALTGRISGVWTVVSGPGTAVLSDTLSSITTISLPDSAYGTYTLRRTESNLGCPSASDDIQITFRQRPIANAGANQPYCGLIQNLFAIPSAASSSPSYSASWTGYTGPGTVVFADVNDPNTAVTADQFGFYTFYWTENNSICPASIDSVRIQLVNPSSPNAGPDEQICGLLDTLGAIPSFGQGLWLNHPSNSGSAVFVNPADPQTIVSVPDYGSYRFDWLEANSPCFANSDFTIINFNQQPLANAGINKDTCSLIAKLGALPSVSGPDYVGSWSGPLGAIFSDIHDPNATVDVSALGYGTYTFTWTEVNGSRCAVSISSVQVGFLETPVADVGTYPSEWCGKQLPLAAIPSVGSGFWTSTPSSGISISNLLDPQATAVVDSFGTYNLTWTETNFGFNGGQCSSSDNFTVTFYPQPTAYAGRDTAICGDQLNLTGFQSVATSNVTWTSPDEPVIQFSDRNALTTDVSTAGVFGLFQIVFTETTGGGFCASSDTLILNLVQQPVAHAGVGDSVCGLSHFLQASPTVGNGLWTSLQPGVSFIPGPGVAQPSLLVPSYGVYDFVWREENGAPCVASFDTVRVGFFDTPRPQAGIDFSICGDSARLAATSGGFAGVWSTINKPAVTFSNPNILAPVTRLNPAASSDYGLVVFKYTESNEDVCSASDEVSVIFIEQPVAEAGVNASLCGLDIYLNAVPGIGTGNWIFNGPDSLLTFFNNAATPNAEARMADFGTYEFIRLERNTPICPEDSDRVSITLFEQPVAFAGNDTVTCSRTINLSAIASVGSGQWTQVAGLGVASFANPADPQSQVTVDQQGSYTFRWTETNGTVCASSSDDVVVLFEDRPLAQAGLDQEVCGLNTVLSATPSVGLGTWSAIAEPGWTLTFGDVNAPNTTLSSNRYGTAVLVWTEIQTAICGAQSDTLTVLFIEQPLAEAGPSDFQICGQNLNLEAQPSVGFGQWSLVSGPVNPTITSPFTASTLLTIPNDGFGTYVLRWTETNASPCVSSFDDVEVTFHQQPVANAGLDQEVCGLVAGLEAIPSVGDGFWFIVPSGTQTASFENFDASQTNVTVNEYGTYAFVWEEQNGTVCPADRNTTMVTFY